jgi:hypothetical protein
VRVIASMTHHLHPNEAMPRQRREIAPSTGADERELAEVTEL